MKTISHTARSKDHLLHIETDLGIINIRVGLKDMDGRPVESISFVPDDYAREDPVMLDGYSNTRFIRVKKESEFAREHTTIPTTLLEELLQAAEKELDQSATSDGLYNCAILAEVRKHITRKE